MTSWFGEIDALFPDSDCSVVERMEILSTDRDSQIDPNLIAETGVQCHKERSEMPSRRQDT